MRRTDETLREREGKALLSGYLPTLFGKVI
jgi:hypothetical protein